MSAQISGMTWYSKAHPNYFGSFLIAKNPLTRRALKAERNNVGVKDNRVPSMDKKQWLTLQFSEITQNTRTSMYKYNTHKNTIPTYSISRYRNGFWYPNSSTGLFKSFMKWLHDLSEYVPTHIRLFALSLEVSFWHHNSQWHKADWDPLRKDTYWEVSVAVSSPEHYSSYWNNRNGNEKVYYC